MSAGSIPISRAMPRATISPRPGTPFVKLRLDEVRTYDVGEIRPDSMYAKQFPDQRAIPGTRIPTLKELFALVRRSGNSCVRFNIETKIDPIIRMNRRIRKPSWRC
jgi:glycerophosphoryl diester phosphodiesterase